MFQFFKQKITSFYGALRSQFSSLFSRNIDQESLSMLKKILIEADTGVQTTSAIMRNVEEAYKRGLLQEGEHLKELLRSTLIYQMEKTVFNHDASIFLLIGINGSGKTTFAAKLAHFYKNQGKRVLLVAADTFRAAAVQQLQAWGQKIDVPVIAGKENQDPASVVFEGCQNYKESGYDILIIDTAGRLQTKDHLMQELTKLKKVIQKQLPQHAIATLLTVDSMLGQNSFEQASVFHGATTISGVVLTKCDGTGKGGIVFRIIDQLNVPVAYVSYGETIDAMTPFDTHDFIDSLLS